MTQTQKVLTLLRERGEEGLTPLDALDIVGSFRLAARISDAKALLPADEEIVTLRATTVNEKVVARYVLRKRVVASAQATLW